MHVIGHEDEAIDRELTAVDEMPETAYEDFFGGLGTKEWEMVESHGCQEMNAP